MVSEYPPKIENLVAAIHLRFTAMAIIAALEAIAIGWFAGHMVGAGIGAAAGVACFFVIRDWGRRLDHRPRGLNLVRARTGAALLSVLLPAGPWFTWSLLRRLHEPVLVRHAVANHPEAGKQADERLLATIRARSAFVTLRTLSIAGIIGGMVGVLLAVVAFLDYREGKPPGPMYLGITIVATALLPIGVYALICAIIGSGKLKDVTAPHIAAARKIAWMVCPIIPYGPYVTWSVTRAFRDDPPGPDSR